MVLTLIVLKIILSFILKKALFFIFISILFGSFFFLKIKHKLILLSSAINIKSYKQNRKICYKNIIWQKSLRIILDKERLSFN